MARGQSPADREGHGGMQQPGCPGCSGRLACFSPLPVDEVAIVSPSAVAGSMCLRQVDC